MHAPLRAFFIIGRRAQALALALALVFTAGITLAAPKKPVGNSQETAPLDASIAIDGRSVHIDAKKPGRLVRLRFRAKAGERLGIGVWAIDLKPESASALVLDVRGPDGQPVPDTGRMNCVAESDSHPVDGCAGRFTTTAAGWHVLEVDTPFSATARFRVALSRPAVAKLDLDRDQTVSVKRLGQPARFKLALDAGQDVVLSARDATPGRGGGDFGLSVFRPGANAPIQQVSGSAALGAALALTGDGGKYEIEFDAAHGKPGVYLVSARSVHELAVDGAPLDVSTSGPNELIRFGLSARAGDTVAIGVKSLAHHPDVEGWSRLTVRKPDGSPLGTIGCMTHPPKDTKSPIRPCKIIVPELPQAGRYSVDLFPPMGAVMTGQVFATVAVTGTIAPGLPLHISSMKPGQVARYTFTATVGQRIGAKLLNLATVPDATRVEVWITPERGYGMLAMWGASGSTVEVPMSPVRTTGNYVITVDPAFGAVQSADLMLEVEGEKPK